MKVDISEIKRKLLVKYPMFGSEIANVNYKDTILGNAPAATDGKTIYYDNDFLENLNINEQLFIFAHEISHIAFNHVLRSEGKEHDVWNYATDAVINQFLMHDGLTMPSIGGVDMKEAINYDAEELYEMLLQKKKEQEKNGNNGENGNSSETDIKINSHDLWESAVENSKEKNNNEENDKNSEGNINSKENNKKSKKQSKGNSKDQKEKISEKEVFKKNSEEKKKELEKLKIEIEEAARKAGKETNEDIRKMGNIGYSKPIIDWRYVLREAITYDVDWSYQNATIEYGILCANLEEQPYPETEILLDTSGSIDNTLLKNFLKECKNILKQSHIKIGCFDTKFYGFNEIRTEEDIENMEFVGGGGTDFDVIPKAFTRRVENKIIFTDGYADMPKVPIDAIWIVFGDEKIKPKGGKVIYITDEQLKRLTMYKSDFKQKKLIKR